MLVGAGGHFCPVARLLNPVVTGVPVVVAQEAEFPSPTVAASGASSHSRVLLLSGSQRLWVVLS